MSDWQAEQGTGWIQIPEFGRINPRRDEEDGGRQYFSAILDNAENAVATGSGVHGGPETWYFEYEQSFLLADRNGDHCIEVEISPLLGTKYAIKYRPSNWPEGDQGGWI